MEAPKKIWINPSMDLPKLNGVIDRDSIQYVRKDDFIERVLNYLDENFFFNRRNYSIESGVFDSKEEMIEDIKKYMEDLL